MSSTLAGLSTFPMIANRRRLGTVLAQDLETFGGKICPLARYPGDVRARSRQTGNKASGNRVARQCEDDRNTVCRLLCRQSALGSIRHNQIDLQLDELGCELISALFPTLGPAILDRDSMPLDPAEFA